MKLLTNFAVYDGCLDEYGSADALASDCAELGLDGVEVVWGHEDDAPETLPNDLVVGYHMLFFSTWVDFWLGKKEALLDEFVTWEAVKDCYGAETPDELVVRFRRDLQRAIDFGAEYVVFHVSDVRMRECFTREFGHTDRQVCDCACELINRIFDGMDTDLALLVENQWWPGFTFTEPEKTEYLLSRIDYPRVGIMLDTGHLMNANTAIRNQADGIEWILSNIEKHGSLAERVYGLHFHQSVSGDYVRVHTGKLPQGFGKDYFEDFATCYPHIQQIDRHRAWTNPDCVKILDAVQPKYLTHELSGHYNQLAAVKRQLGTIRKGYGKNQ